MVENMGKYKVRCNSSNYLNQLAKNYNLRIGKYLNPSIPKFLNIYNPTRSGWEQYWERRYEKSTLD